METKYITINLLIKVFKNFGKYFILFIFFLSDTEKGRNKPCDKPHRKKDEDSPCQNPRKINVVKIDLF